MAPLKVRKPAAIMFDLVAMTTKSFFGQVISPYIKKNAKTYLEDNWPSEVVQQDVKLLREAAKKDKSSVQIADASADAETIQRTVCDYVNKALDELKDNEALAQFRFHIILDGYAKDRIETPVNTDVAIQIHNWAADEKIKLYVFSNGWKEATKRCLQKTNHGDLNLLIEDYFDTSDEPFTDPATFKKVVDKVKQAPEDILFLTHSGKEGYAAKQAGLSVILIMTHRRDVKKLSEQEKKDLPYCRTFNQIIFSSDAPKARELDGSSVVASSAAMASVTTTRSTASAKSKKSKKPTSSASSGSKTGSKSADDKKSDSSATKSKSASKGDGVSKTSSKTGSKAGSKAASTEGGGSKSTDGSSAVDKSASKSSSKSNSKAGSKAGSSAGSKASSADGGGSTKPTDESKAGSETSSANGRKSTSGSQAGSATGGTSADGGSASSGSQSGSK